MITFALQSCSSYVDIIVQEGGNVRVRLHIYEASTTLQIEAFIDGQARTAVSAWHDSIFFFAKMFWLSWYNNEFIFGEYHSTHGRRQLLAAPQSAGTGIRSAHLTVSVGNAAPYQYCLTVFPRK